MSVLLIKLASLIIMVSNYKIKTNRASYSKESLQAAVRSVRNGSLSGYMAAKEFKIPRMTIMDHVNNKRIKSNSLGRNTALTLEIENRLATCLHFMEKHGLGLTKAEILEMVGQFVKKNKIQTPFKDGKPGNAWFNGFKKRHHLSVKKPQAVEYSRKQAINPFIVYPYYDLLEKTLKKLNLLEKPSAIWNLDETSFSKDPAKTKIVGLTGHAAIRVISSTGKENTTVLLGGNAQGDKLPPLIIYKGKHMWDTWMSPEAYPNTTYAATKNGWMESDVFEMYFKKTFLPAIGDERPVLLIYDGHATHVGLNIIEEARKASITILKLPAHTSHILQPLDLAVMKPFKDRWDQLLVQWQRLNVGVALSKQEFARLIGLVWVQIDAQVLRNGFRKAGIFPFNPKVVEEKHFDSLKLKQWKDLQREPQNNLNQVAPEECPISEDEMQSSISTQSDLKTLLSLALDCVTKVAHITTNEGLDNQKSRYNYEKSLRGDEKLEIPSCDSPSTTNATDLNGENEIGQHSNKPSTYNVPKSMEKYDLNNGKKIQVLEDRIVSFEELLLMKIKAGNNTKLKRQKMGPGAEVITHDDVLKRKMEEKIKNMKQEPEQIESKIQKSHDLLEPAPGPSGVTKKPCKEQSQSTFISKKGKGIGKKTRVIEEKQKTTIKSRKKRRVRATSDSTSVSDCISIYSDFDICNSDDLELHSDEMETSKTDTQKRPEENIKVKHNCKFEKENYEDREQDKAIFDEKEEAKRPEENKKDKYNCEFEKENYEDREQNKAIFDDKEEAKRPEENKKDKHNCEFEKENYEDREQNKAIFDDKEEAKRPEENKKDKHNCEFEKENYEDREQNKAIFDDKEEADFVVNDNVLVRYFNRKKWTYYTGYVEGLKTSDNDEVYYTIRFYKTVKKPLMFILTKKIDRDDVPSTSIVKKITLTQDAGNPKNFLLSSDEDTVYFIT